MMETLVIDRKGCRISLAGRRIRIDAAEKSPRFVPVAMVKRLVITAATDIQSSVFTALAAEGASVLMLSPRDHRRTAVITPPHVGDHLLRLKQYQMITDPVLSLDVARTVIRLKLHGQRRFLNSLPLKGQASRQAKRAFPDIIRRVHLATTLDAVRGYEGGAASLYFGVLVENAPAGWHFDGRRRRPPPDPVNALLSLSYTLMHFEAVRRLHAAGLDPCLGFLHAPEYSRESLACDCLEPLRPLIDRFVFDLFRHGVIRPDHFCEQQGACRLGKAGRAIFYAEWAQFLPFPVRTLRRGVGLLKQMLEELRS